MSVIELRGIPPHKLKSSSGIPVGQLGKLVSGRTSSSLGIKPHPVLKWIQKRNMDSFHIQYKKETDAENKVICQAVILIVFLFILFVSLYKNIYLFSVHCLNIC